MLQRTPAAAKSAGRLLWKTITEFIADGCPQMAAALSYSTLFSLPPLILLLTLVTEPFLDAERSATALQAQIGGVLGPRGAEQVQLLIANVRPPGEGGPIPAILGVLAFVFGATVAFAQLQNSLNAAWRVGPDPTRGDVKNFLLKRVLSFAMIMGVGFLLLVSLVVSTLLAAFGELLSRAAPEWVTEALLVGVNGGISFAVVALLFSAMYRYLPDAVVAWRHALVGGVATALLFTLGKLGIGAYLAESDPGSVYGAAGSLAVVLLWVYYSAMAVLLGAEFTRIWARSRGHPIEPEPGAVRIVYNQERVVSPPAR